jgi:hypothetical protein
MARAPRLARISLNPVELAILNGSWAGSGGFQTLGPKLRAKVSPVGELELDDNEVGIIMRHMGYANSGFRSRVRKVFRRSFEEIMSRK